MPLLPVSRGRSRDTLRGPGRRGPSASPSARPRGPACCQGLLGNLGVVLENGQRSSQVLLAVVLRCRVVRRARGDPDRADPPGDLVGGGGEVVGLGVTDQRHALGSRARLGRQVRRGVGPPEQPLTAAVRTASTATAPMCTSTSLSARLVGNVHRHHLPLVAVAAATERAAFGVRTGSR